MAFRDLFRRKEAEPAGDMIAAEPNLQEDGAYPLKAAVDDKAIAKATVLLNKYKGGKANLENKLKANEEYWKMTQWDKSVGNAKVRGENSEYKVTATPWLHTCIESRHADAMDSYPTCNFRPRQEDDKQEANRLTAIVPVILAQNHFEETYDKISRDTLKHGTGVYGVFWDPHKHNGLGDIAVRPVSLLNLFWEPGVTDIQESANVFHTVLVDNDVLEQRYPQTKHKLGGKNIAVSKFMYDDSVDTSHKSVVVDWYYHKINRQGQRVLHYCKYVNDVVLYSSENEPDTAETGFYQHGQYPFVVQALYPVEGTICGYGLTDVGKGTQLQIDLMNKAIVDNAEEGAAARYFVKNNGTVNEKEFADKTKKLVHVEGALNEENIRPIDTPALASIYPNYLSAKVDELKFCTANQDVNNGAAPSGVTSGSAIAALQESSGKHARSSNRTFHRAYRDVVYQIIELIRQFYNQPRQFRIAPDGMKEQFVNYSNAGIVPQQQMLGGQPMGFRIPEFDIDITTEKANPYKKLERNELMLQFYNLGIFNPQNSDMSIALLSNMDFDGRDDLITQIKQNGTMFDLLLRFQKLALQLAQGADPDLAHKVAQLILQVTGQPAAAPMAGEEEIPTAEGEEHPFVEKSRAQARNSTEAE
jgi:hypothetical protein